MVGQAASSAAPAAPDTTPLPWLAGPMRQAMAQPGHALLVVAAPGIGALDFQLGLAKAWLCEQGATAPAAASAGRLACGQCSSCRLFSAHTHPDLQLLLPGVLALAHGLATEEQVTNHGKRKPSKWILMDEVRAALDWVATTRSRSMGKVVLLHPAEALQTVTANALLKALEEPPAGVRWLLSCSDPERLLPTVRSRCQWLELPAPTAHASLAWLQAQGVADPAVLLAAGGGRPLDALALHQAGVKAATWAALPRALACGQAAAWAGWPLPRVIDALQKICHDLMAVAVGAAPRYFDAATLPRGADVAALAGWAQALGRAAASAEHPWSEALRVDALVMQGRQAVAAGPPLATLVR